MNLYTTTVTLFLVMNPLGNIPVFISTLQYVDPKRRLTILIRESFFALIILVIFLFAGHAIIKGLQVTEPALGIAGGIILFLIAIKLIFPPPKINNDTPISEPFLVPLATPLFAGPATMATTMLLATQNPGETSSMLASLFFAWLLSAILIISSSTLSRMLGSRGLTALERLMGMILTTLAVQMFFTGIQSFFHLT